MQLFHLFAVPLAYGYYLIAKGETTATPQLVSRAVARGVAFSIVVLVILVMFRRPLDTSGAGVSYYLSVSMHDFWLPSSLLLGLYALTAGGLQQLSAHERHLGLLSFFAGAFSAISVIDLFFGAEYPDAYQLFYLPAMRVALVLAVPALFYWYSDLIGWIRYIVLAGIFLLPFLFGVVAVLSLSNLVLPAVVTAIFLFVVCTFAGMTAVGGVRSLIR